MAVLLRAPARSRAARRVSRGIDGDFGMGIETRSGPAGGILVAVVSGKSRLIARASVSVATRMPAWLPLTSCKRASVWLSEPSAFFTHVLPSGSELARSASKSAPTACAMFSATASTSGERLGSSWSAASALPRLSRASFTLFAPEYVIA